MVDCSLEKQLERDMVIENNQGATEQIREQIKDRFECDYDELTHLTNKEIKNEILNGLSDFVEMILPTMSDEEKLELKEKAEQKKAKQGIGKSDELIYL